MRKANTVRSPKHADASPRVTRQGSSHARKQPQILVCLLLFAATLAVFAQTAGHDFVNWDDNVYVYNNTHVISGLTLSGIAWALQSTHAANWHPLTWVSHMIDCQLFGLWPGGHHLTSVCLHATAAVSLFLALGEMTGRLWPSAFVAAVFALHPLRRIGGLGRGAEGRVERPVLHAHALGVRAVRRAILRTP